MTQQIIKQHSNSTLPNLSKLGDPLIGSINELRAVKTESDLNQAVLLIDSLLERLPHSGLKWFSRGYILQIKPTSTNDLINTTNIIKSLNKRDIKIVPRLVFSETVYGLNVEGFFDITCMHYTHCTKKPPIPFIDFNGTISKKTFNALRDDLTKMALLCPASESGYYHPEISNGTQVLLFSENGTQIFLKEPQQIRQIRDEDKEVFIDQMESLLQRLLQKCS